MIPHIHDSLLSNILKMLIYYYCYNANKFYLFTTVKQLWNDTTCIYFITSRHSLTPLSRVLLENLTGFQLVKKFSAF